MQAHEAESMNEDVEPTGLTEEGTLCEDSRVIEASVFTEEGNRLCEESRVIEAHGHTEKGAMVYEDSSVVEGTGLAEESDTGILLAYMHDLRGDFMRELASLTRPPLAGGGSPGNHGTRPTSRHRSVDIFMTQEARSSDTTKSERWPTITGHRTHMHTYGKLAFVTSIRNNLDT